MPTSRRRTPSSTTSQDAPVDPDHPASSTVSAARTTGAANVRWIEDVDFWIAQAVHAGSGDRSTAGKPPVNPGTRFGQCLGRWEPKARAFRTTT